MRKVLNVLFLIVLILGCNKSPNDPKQYTIPFDDQKSIAENTIDQYQELLEDNSEAEARAKLAESLRKIDGVQEAGISADGITVWWKVKNGGEYCLLTETKASVTDTTDYQNLNKSFNENIIETFFRALEFPHNKKALILSPYQWDWNLLGGLIPIQDETHFINTILSQVDYTTTFKVNKTKKEQNVSLNDYKSFNNYGVIAISTHGGLTSSNEVFFSSGVIVNDSNYWDNYSEIINGQLVGVVYIDKWFSKDVLTVGITPKWIEKNYPNKLDATLFYLGSCKGLYNESLGGKIIGKGSTYFSWTENTSVDQASKTGKDLFTQLVTNGYNCSEAQQELVKNGNDTYSPWFGLGTESKFKYIGEDELRLVEEPLKIAVSPAGYDDIATLLRSFGHEVESIPLSYLTDYGELSEYDIIALNCAKELGSISTSASTAIRQFVSNGGKLYASDWAYQFIDKAFPGYINFPSWPYIGNPQEVTAQIDNIPLKEYLGIDNLQVVYDLDLWVVIDGVGESTSVLVSGDVVTDGALQKADLTRRSDIQSQKISTTSTSESNRPLAVSFDYGKGKVVYTTFHNEKQLSEPVRHILEYFTIIE